MARLIYKEGFEDQNKLEYIEGIEIDLLNNYKDKRRYLNTR